MNVLIIYAHPSEDSFTFKVLNKLKQGLSDSGHKIEVSDLYEIGFKSDMSPAEYNREGLAKTELSIATDVKVEHQKLNRADCVCFLYPVWWSDCPAKLKGWFDRVYSVGYAYSKTETPREMQQIKHGLVICTAGHSNQELEETGIAESMRKVMINDRLANRFNHKEMIILGGTLEGSSRKEILLKKAYQIGTEINEAQRNTNT